MISALEMLLNSLVCTLLTNIKVYTIPDGLATRTCISKAMQKNTTKQSRAKGKRQYIKQTKQILIKLV